MFNDDKKTDLIGETWIDLTAVIRAGGGQSDQWHGLNCKGRYAGEIRIELTYYDSRPKIEKHHSRDRKQSGVDSSEQSPTSSLSGPRQLQANVRRRPLPSEVAQSQNPALSRARTLPESIPMPQNHHFPQRPETHGHNHAESFDNNGQDAFRRSGSAMSDAAGRKTPSLSESFSTYHGHYNQNSQVQAFEYNGHMPANSNGHQSNDMFQQEVIPYENAAANYIAASDDPYALQAVEETQKSWEDQDATAQFQLARNNRVQALSASQNSSSPPMIPLTHAYSAPVYGSPDQIELYHRGPAPGGYTPGQHTISHGHDPYYSQEPSGNSLNRPFVENDNQFARFDDENLAYGSMNRTRPPPPPEHRNSAPAVARATFKHSPPAHNISPPILYPESPAHSGYNGNSHYRGQDRYYSEPQTHARLPFIPCPSYPTAEHASVPQNYGSLVSTNGTAGQLTDAQVSSHATLQPATASVPAFDPQHNYDYQPRADLHNNTHDNYGASTQYGQVREQHRFSSTPHDAGMRQYPTLTPMIKPRPVSPNRSTLPQLPSQTHPLQHSATPYTTAQGTPSAVPFSPDSFAVFNPRHSNPTTPITSIVENRTAPQRTTPQYTKQSPPVPQPKAPSPQVAKGGDAPIIGSDGRVRDPSDHLPPSSYAPEPERKGGRESAAVRVRNRFGPREAPPILITTRQPRSAPASPLVNKGPAMRIGLQQAAPDTQALNGRPLNQSQQGTLNAQSGPASSLTSARGYGYDRVEMFAPPVPDKIPLDASGFGTNNSQSNTQLSKSMAALNLNGTNTTAKGPLSRMRKSRWGA